MNILKSLILFCLVLITISQAKYFGCEYAELKCPYDKNQLCPIYKIYEIGNNTNVYSLNYADFYVLFDGKKFQPYQIIVKGDFTNGVFKMESAYRVMAHPNREFDYSNNDKFFTMKTENTIHQINSNGSKSNINSIFNTYKDEVPNFPNDWFNKLVLNGDAVFTTISNHIDNGAGQTQIDYAWISITRNVACPKQSISCQFPFILQPSYERNDDRCLLFKGCIRILKNPLCVLDIDLRGCPIGYKKTAYLGYDGCQKMYCDPSFL